MKKFYLVILLCFSLTSYSQDFGSDFPKATVNQVLVDDIITYSFKSNYLIDEYKAPMLEKRFLGRYSELIDISIVYDTQIISFKILNKDSKVFLEKFVTHFKYNGYEID